MSWATFTCFWARKPARRRPIRKAQLALEALEERLAPAVNVLTPNNVAVGSFGKLFTVPLDGQVYAEPLVDTAVTIADGPNTTAGAAGAHDVVFVATEHDSLYAIDASVAGGAVLWKRSFLD